jgi:hypothetical protein
MAHDLTEAINRLVWMHGIVLDEAQHKAVRELIEREREAAREEGWDAGYEAANEEHEMNV